MPNEKCDRERGQATLLALCAVVVAALTTVLVARVVVVVADQARAQHAADAAALAGVTGGPTAAESIAAANGADLVTFVSDVGTSGGTIRVTVVVRRGDRTARASAEGDPRTTRSGP